MLLSFVFLVRVGVFYVVVYMSFLQTGIISVSEISNRNDCYVLLLFKMLPYINLLCFCLTLARTDLRYLIRFVHVLCVCVSFV